jgi:hypothetical protein
LRDDDDRLPQHTDSAATGDIGVSRTRTIFLEELGWLFREQSSMDYGIDAHVEVVDSRSVLGLLLALQIKGGSRYFRSPSPDGWWFRARKGQFRYWLGHTIPVVIVLVDVGNRVGYWQLVSESTVVEQDAREWKLEVPRGNVLDRSAVVPLRTIAEAGARRAGDRRPVGAPVGEFDPADLEVHIAVPGSAVHSAAPPEYLIRAHDRTLDRLVADALGPAPKSGHVMLVGGSSTGKTRALYEMLHRRVDVGQVHGSLASSGWRVWPSLNPLPPRRFLDELGSVGPRTVVWLNEAQRYLLDPPAELRTEIATALRELLMDSARGPVLLLGTLWPEFWVELTRKPTAGEADQFVAARRLVEHSYVHVPDTFTSVEVDAARRSLDQRVVQAASQDASSSVTQYLAGGPDLLRRWETAGPTQRAVIHAAMDARRLGHREEFSEVFLRDIARCYLEGPDRQRADDEPHWFGEAVAELARLGVSGVPVLQEGLIGYRLNDFLDQEGRVTRRFEFPPEEFWSVVANSDLAADSRIRFAEEAASRLRLRIAAHLYETTGTPAAGKALCELALHFEKGKRPQTAERLVQSAVAAGFPEALMSLAKSRYLRGGSHHETEFMSLLRQAADLGQVEAMEMIADQLERAGKRSEAEAVAQRAVELGSWEAMISVAEWRDLDFPDEAEELVNRLPADQRMAALTRLAIGRDEVDDFDRAERLAFSLLANGEPEALLMIAERRAESGRKDHARWLLSHVATPRSVEKVLELAVLHHRAGDHHAARSLVEHAVATATGRKASKGGAGFEQLGRWFADFIEAHPDAVMQLGTALRVLDERHLERKLDEAWSRQRPTRPAPELDEDDEDEPYADFDYEVREACTTLAAYHARRGELPAAKALAFQAASMGSPVGLTALSRELGQRGDRDEAERLALYAVNMEAPGDALAEARGDATLLVLGLDAAGNTSAPW